MKRSSLIPLAAAAAVILPMLAPSCANTTQAPTGGDRDSIPPVLIWTIPAPGTVMMPTHRTKIVFGFDEYVTIKDPKSVFLSPPQSKAPKSAIKGKSLEVTFEDDLEPNTTYTLTFNGALADNNEGNMWPGYTFCFSTGERIDSLMITGTVIDFETLQPKKGATVMLYKDSADSAVMLSRPYAAVKTDDWGFFALPFLQDTLFRLYAVEDENADNKYDPETERVAFCDTAIRPSMKVCDTIPEMLNLDMKDTLACRERTAQYKLRTFREKPSKQFIIRNGRTADRSAYISFNAPDAWIDSLWIQGYKAGSVITSFNSTMDSLEIWVNDRRPVPDTLHLWVNYRKTDSLGVMQPFLEHVKLFREGVGAKKKSARAAARELKHEDTICVFKLGAKPETVEQNGFELEFSLPIIYEHFDSLKFHYLTPKQKDETGTFTVEPDSTNIRKFRIRPGTKLQQGYEYFLKVPPPKLTCFIGYILLSITKSSGIRPF